MGFSFKKNITVGVSVTPGIGLEAAQIDFRTRKIVKYGSKPLNYDNNRKEIADMDVFKETLQELLLELGIPKGADLVINIPAVYFGVKDLPASFEGDQVDMAFEEELGNIPIFQNNDPCSSIVRMPNSTIQFSKFVCTAAQKVMLIEMVMQVMDIGYNIAGIDVSVNSILNSLVYNDRINTSPDASWVLLLVENNCCRVVSMAGKNYVDYFEEKISIGEVLGEEENYSTVANAVAPLLKSVPSRCLYVISKTNLISAEALAKRIKYSAPIIHQEANSFNHDAFLSAAADIPPEIAKGISLDVIGAAIKNALGSRSVADLNLFNEDLGDPYTLSQPPILKLGSRKFVLSMDNMITLSIFFTIIALAIIAAVIIPLNQINNQKQTQISDIKRQISEIETFLKQNESISSDLFDEGDEIRMGLASNKNIYSYYTIVGTEIPQKLWLTSLTLGKYTTIRGQADNLESVYGFFRNIKDYNPESAIKLQKLGLAFGSNRKALTDFDTDSVITSMNADYYEFVISDSPEEAAKAKNDGKKDNNKAKKNNSGLPEGLEPLE